jgi:hypothetical protein
MNARKSQKVLAFVKAPHHNFGVSFSNQINAQH